MTLAFAAKVAENRNEVSGRNGAVPTSGRDEAPVSAPPVEQALPPGGAFFLSDFTYFVVRLTNMPPDPDLFQFFGPPILVFVAIVVTLSVLSSMTKKSATDAYDQSLQSLRDDPTNDHLLCTTIELCRTYSQSMFREGGSTFPEEALMNDIQLATHAKNVSEATSPVTETDVTVRLKKTKISS